MPNTDYVDFARDAWDEAAPIHWRTTHKLIEELRDPGASFLDPVHVSELERLGIAGRHVAQLNCNNGRELISIVRLGAASGTGFDISSGFIEQARELASVGGEICRFECSDVYEIPGKFNGLFDVVVITAGALCFMPDLTRYFEVARRLLGPGGRLNIFESHPITEMFLLDRDRAGRPLEMVYSYFDDTPIRHESGLDYIHNEQYDAKPIYYFHHKLSDIFSAIIAAGFVIERFQEHDADPSQALTEVAAMPVKPPLSFLLTARKSD